VAIGTVVTRGYGSGATIALVVTRGYGSGAPVIPPVVTATTAGGGRKHRVRFSRAMAYSPLIETERKKHIDDVVEAIRDEIEQKAIEIAKLDQLRIEEARFKARQAFSLERAVEQARKTERRLLTLSNRIRENAELIDALKQFQLEQDAILMILMASETYNA